MRPAALRRCQREASSDLWSRTRGRAGSERSISCHGTRYLGLPMGSGPQPRPLGTLELSGSATAADDASIVLVDSSWYVAARNQFGSFTAKSLSPAIEVRAGQIIHVRVVFSFS